MTAMWYIANTASQITEWYFAMVPGNGTIPLMGNGNKREEQMESYPSVIVMLIGLAFFVGGLMWAWSEYTR